jgi:two-component system alkaline phosphatase synthesis response regulator PhoP
LATVLALDKDPWQLELLTFLLKQEGHHVYATADPETALDTLQSKLIDLVIVETALPRVDGYKVCQQMRQLNPCTPLMILSERHEEEQIVRGLMGAADDYLTKPFSPRQLLARVHALLRRANVTHGSRLRDENVSIGEITLNLQQMHAMVNGKRVPLTPRELSLLHALMDNSGRILSRDQLMRLAWGDHFVGCSKTVDVTIQRVRKKLRPHLTAGYYIHALRGFGYKFEMPRPTHDAALQREDFKAVAEVATSA